MIEALIGGVIIGLSAIMMLAGNGKITGISGILGSTLSAPKSEHNWRYAFLIGLILGGFLFKFLMPDFFNYQFSGNTLQVISAGLLVGFGTRLGSGCTSGHGVCGLPRFSPRSLAATLIFMGSGIVTVLLMKGIFS